MTKALAVARVTVAESIRRRALFVLLVLWAVWAVFTLSLPGVEASHRVRLALSGNLQATDFFVLLLAVFLVSTAIPREFEDKRIFLILTKPVRTWDYLLGKFLGFAAFFALVLGASYGMLAILFSAAFRDLASDQDRENLYARRLLTAEEFEVRSPPPAEPLRPEEEGGSLAVDDEHPEAAWTFRGLESDDLPEGPLFAQVALRFQPVGRLLDPGDRATFRLRLVEPRSGRSHVVELQALYGQAQVVEFPREVLGSSSEVEVVLERTDPGYTFLVGHRDAVVHRSREHYLLNVAKGIVVVYAETLLVVAVALLASSFLSGPVAVLFSLTFLVVGHFLAFLRMTAERMTSTEAVADMWATLTNNEVHGHAPAEAAPEPSAALEAVQRAIEAFCSVFPDLQRFGASDSVAEGISLTGSGILRAALYSGTYVAICLVAGWLFLSTIDVERREGPLVRLVAMLRRPRS